MQTVKGDEGMWFIANYGDAFLVIGGDCYVS